MATSGSTDFTMTARDIATEALRLIGVLDANEEADASDAAKALLALELMLKTWGANPRLWLKSEGSITLTATTQSYSIPLARRVYSVRRRTSSLDTPLMEMAREQYFDTPTKSATGMPNSYYFDPQRATRTLYVWPTASTAVAASTTLQYTYARVIEDVDSLNNNPDVPQEWLDALIYGLAKRLGPSFGVSATPDYREVKEQADILFAIISADDDEDASVFLQPDRGY